MSSLRLSFRFSDALALVFLILAGSICTGQVNAQSVDTIVVFDGSNSMWGQIDGRAKIEIARETLSSVLSESGSEMQIGLIAYGHRERGGCTDIESLVPVGPANQTVPAIIDAASRITPRGKTPLTDAVRKAAEELRYTENAATVVLVTDGIETCEADPCALGAELEKFGINFTAHVVGFGLTEEEGQQVQCLAENTGGLYLSAGNANALRDALEQTVTAEIDASEDDFGPATSTDRNVTFIFRDTPDGPQIGIRQLSGSVETENGDPVADTAFEFAYPEANGASANAVLSPGHYVGVFRRDGGSRGGYDVRYEFEVPEGDGDHVIEASLSGALTINPYVNPGLPIVKGEPFPTAVGGSRPRVHFAIFPIRDGKKTEQPAATATLDSLTLPLSPGHYLVQGNLDSGTSAERLVEVKSGDATQLDFSFDATRVFVDAREADGAPVKRQTTFWYDKMPKGSGYWVSGGGAGDSGLAPFYLPTGEWGLNVGGEGYGARRSEILVHVPGDYKDLTVKVGEGERLTDNEEALLKTRENGCVEILKVTYKGCLVERASLNGTTESSAKSPPEGQDNQAQGAQKASDPDAGNGLAPAYASAGAARLTFNHRSTNQASALIERADSGDVTVTLLDGWCGSSNCSGSSFAVDPSLMRAVEVGERKTFAINEILEIHTAPAGFSDMLTVVFDPTAPNPVKGVMVRVEDQASLEGQKAQDTGSGAYAPGTIIEINKLNVPFGIYAAVPGHDTIDGVRPQALDICVNTPTVIEAGGSMRMKAFDSTSGTYEQIMYSECSSWESDEKVTCTVSRGTPEFPEPFKSMPLPAYSALGDGHFRGCVDSDAGESCQIFYSCVHPGGPLTVEQSLPSGERSVDEILKTYKGGSAGYRYVDNFSFEIEERRR